MRLGKNWIMVSLKRVASGLMLSCGLAAAAQAAPLTTSFTVSGDVGTPGTYTAATLAAFPTATETETYAAAGVPVTDTFTGPTLLSVLGAAGGITTDAANKNDILRKYIVATGSDGYEAVIAAGEISTKFGNKPDLIATSDSASRLPSPDGFARVVAAGDVAGGRYVSNLADLHVGTSPAQSGTGGGTTSSFVLQGGVAHPQTDTLAQLQALAAYTETVTYLSGASTVTDTYTGALLWDVLNSTGITTTASIKNDILRKLVTVTGSDGYQVDFSLGEIDPAFGNEPILVAYSDTGGQLTGGSGFARLVVPGDSAGGRYVSNLASLTVFDPTVVPEPGSMGLVLVGVVTAAMLRQRRGRRPEVAPQAA